MSISDINNIKTLNPTNSNSVGSEISSASSTTQSSSAWNDVPVETVKLTEDDRAVMLHYGYNPDDTEAVKKWLALPETERVSMAEKYWEVKNQTVTEQKSQNENTQQNELNIKLPENWNELSVKEKQNFMFNALGKHYYKDWDSKSQEEKRQLIEKGLSDFCKHVDPQFQYYNDKDKVKSMTFAYQMFGVMLEKASPEDLENIGNGGLSKIFENLHQTDKNEIKQTAKRVAKDLGLEISEQDRVIIDDFRAIKEYYGLSSGREITDELRLKYYSELKASGQELNAYQQEEFNTLTEIKQVDPNYLKRELDTDTPKTTLQEVFSDTKFIEGKNGTIRRCDTNAERLQEAVTERFGNTLSLAADSDELKQKQEEFTNVLNGLSRNEAKLLLRAALRDKNFDKRLLQNIESSRSGEIVVAANDKKVSKENQTYATRLHTEQLSLRQKNGENIETKGFYDYVQSDKNNFTTETKGNLIASVAENFGTQEEIDKVQRSTKENSEDYNEIFKISDGLINDSEKISDELKEFYARNSIDIMDNDTDRNARAESLRSFNSDSFNKGVDTGLSNVSNNDNLDVNQANNSLDETNYIENTTSSNQQIYNTLSPQSQEVYTTLNLLQGELSRTEAIKLFTSLSRKEQAEVLNALTPQQIGKLPVTVCEDFPELIPSFVNAGKGLEIISKCSTVTQYITIRAMKSGGNKSRLELSEYIATNSEQFSKITQDWATKVRNVKEKTEVLNPLHFKA